MIAVDTSALTAIALEEPDHATFMKLVAMSDAVIGTPTLVELSSALTRLGPQRIDAFVSRLIRAGAVRPVDFTFDMYEAAKIAYRRFGKGQGHPAQLNFGDCMSYGVARTLGLPLLFKGQDFASTDIEPAWRP